MQSNYNILWYLLFVVIMRLYISIGIQEYYKTYLNIFDRHNDFFNLYTDNFNTILFIIQI